MSWMVVSSKFVLLKLIGLLNQLILLNNLDNFFGIMILGIIWIKLKHLIDFVVSLIFIFFKYFGFVMA